MVVTAAGTPALPPQHPTGDLGLLARVTKAARTPVAAGLQGTPRAAELAGIPHPQGVGAGLPEPTTLVPAPDAATLLAGWIAERAAPGGPAWLEATRAGLAGGAPPRALFAAFGLAPRRLGKADLALGPDELAAADMAQAGWSPGHWSVDQAGRALLLLSLPSADAEVEAVERLAGAAEVGEAVAIHQALPVLRGGARHRARAAEGLRGNMAAVFDAVALRNPYPAEHLDEGAWNQMVLKALFVGSPLHLVQGLDARCNPTLARMLADYARERWAARRPVPPELWRPVGPFAEGALLDDLARVLDQPSPVQQEAAALALAASPAPRARRVLAARPDLAARVAGGELTWGSLVRGRSPSELHLRP